MSDAQMPEHHRSGDSEAEHNRSLKAVAESATAKFFARIVTPALLTLVLGLGAWIGNRMLAQLDYQGSQLSDQGRDMQSVKSDVRDLNTRMTEGVIRQVNSHSSRIDDHEKRLQVIERTVRTP